MLGMSIQLPPPNAPDSLFESLWQEHPLRIGRGTNRDAFEVKDHPDKVLKVMTVPSNAANWAEIVVHIYSVDKSYFGSIHTWSLSGRFLIMEKLTDVTFSDLALHHVPAFVNDKKVSAFGRAADGAIKLRDYGMLTIGSGPLFCFPAT